MAAIKIAVRIDAIPQSHTSKSTLRRSLELAASMGCEAVELCGRTVVPVSELSDTGVRALRKILDDLNLRVAAIRFPTRNGFDHLPQLDRRVEATKLAMKAAYRLGAPIVINQIGQVPEPPASSGGTSASAAALELATLTDLGQSALAGDDEDVRRLLAAASDLRSNGTTAKPTTVSADDQRWNTMQSVLEDLGRYGAKVGAVMAAETGTESGETLAKLLRASDEAFVTAALNPGQLIVNRHSVPEAIRALGDRISIVSAVDGVVDLAAGRGLTVPLGQGIADFPNLIGQLEDIPYRGVFVIGRPDMDSSTAVDELRQAASYLSHL